jgi:hypothetical protein
MKKLLEEWVFEINNDGSIKIILDLKKKNETVLNNEKVNF